MGNPWAHIIERPIQSETAYTVYFFVDLWWKNQILSWIWNHPTQNNRCLGQGITTMKFLGSKKLVTQNFQPAAPHVQTAKPFVRQYAHMGFVDISIPHSGNMKFLDFFPEWNPQPPQIQAVGSNPGSWIKSRQLDDHSKSLHTWKLEWFFPTPVRSEGSWFPFMGRIKPENTPPRKSLKNNISPVPSSFLFL